MLWLNRRENIGIIIGTLGVFAPSLVIAGFLPFEFLNSVPLSCWLMITTYSCAFGSAIYHYTYKGNLVPTFIGGAVSGFLIPFAIYYYVILRSNLGDKFLKIEFLIPIAIGIIPGILTHKLLTGRQPIR